MIVPRNLTSEIQENPVEISGDQSEKMIYVKLEANSSSDSLGINLGDYNSSECGSVEIVKSEILSP